MSQPAPPPDADPVVDDDTADGIRQALRRVLESVAPDSLVAGGGQSFDDLFGGTARDLETLAEREAIYRTGGPVTDMIDSRALMTYGTGATFETESLVEDDEGRTVDEWLHDAFPTLDLVHIEAGIQSYWAGDAWPEVVETRGGEFSHVTLVDPTTVDVAWDDHGEIEGLRQVIDNGANFDTEPLDPDDVSHFWFKRTTGGPLGESLIAQNRDEIDMFARNLRQRANAIKQHGSPKFDVSVGSERGQQIPDTLLRRVRSRIFGSGGVDENTNLVHGGGITIETLDAPGFEGMDSIVETDARILSWGFGIPLEYTNMGSAGLGEGTPAESRKLKFERQARAEQKNRSAQFIEQVVRPVLEEYSPFPRDIDIQHVFGDVVSDQEASAKWMVDFKSYLTPEEVRERLDLPTDVDAEELGPPEGTPDAEGQDIGGGGGVGGGLFATERQLSEPGHHLGEDGFHRIIETVLWSDDTERALFGYDPEDVPKFVKERLQEAIPEAVSNIDSFASISEAQRGQLVDTLQDALESQHGWSIRSIRENLQDMDPDLEKHEAELLGRDVTQKAVSKAREDHYADEFDLEEERFYGVNPMNNRTTDACKFLVGETNPRHGGTPVTLDRYRELVEEANRRDDDIDHDPSEYNPHIACRTQYVRAV